MRAHPRCSVAGSIGCKALVGAHHSLVGAATRQRNGATIGAASVDGDHDCVDLRSTFHPRECNTLDDAAAQDHEDDQHRQRRDHGPAMSLSVLNLNWKTVRPTFWRTRTDDSNNSWIFCTMLSRELGRANERGRSVNSSALDHHLLKWRLTRDGEPFETRTSWLLPVLQDGYPAMLKVFEPEIDEQASAEVLRFFDGSGAATIQLLRSNQC
jgi:Aminoglycoside/hydroxyurea antibiotic resistance kinase